VSLPVISARYRSCLAHRLRTPGDGCPYNRIRRDTALRCPQTQLCMKKGPGSSPEPILHTTIISRKTHLSIPFLSRCANATRLTDIRARCTASRYFPNPLGNVPALHIVYGHPGTGVPTINTVGTPLCGVRKRNAFDHSFVLYPGSSRYPCYLLGIVPALQIFYCRERPMCRSASATVHEKRPWVIPRANSSCYHYITENPFVNPVFVPLCKRNALDRYTCKRNALDRYACKVHCVSLLP